MTSRLTILALAGLCGAALAAPAAKADVIYTFTTTSATTGDPYYHDGVGPSLKLSFDLLGATVDQGSFSLVGHNFISPPGTMLFPPSYVGDANGFVSLSYGVGDNQRGFGGDTVTPTLDRDIISVNMTFAGNGDVTASRVDFEGNTEGTKISGTGASASGFVGTDDTSFGCDGLSNCAVSGVWTHSGYTPSPSTDPADVPEPASFAILGFGVLGLGLARRGLRGSAAVG